MMKLKNDENGYYTPAGVAMIVVGAVLALFLLIAVFGFYNVNAGERAIEHNRWFGEFSVEDEGTHWRFPLSTKVTVYDVRVQKEQVDAAAATRDAQDVKATIAVNYQVREHDLLDIHRGISGKYQNTVLEPALQGTIKTCSAKYPLEELIQNRTAFQQCVRGNIVPKMAERDIHIDNIEVVNLEFSQAITHAIEAKQVAEQEALRQVNLLAAERAKADQKIEQARGQAESARIIGEQVALHGEAYLFLQWIDAWREGGSQVPSTLVQSEGGDTPFLLTINPGGHR